MGQKSIEKNAQRSQRRAFFGHFLAAVGGGFLGGSILQRLFSTRKVNHEGGQSVTIRTNPLAVPRSKEGSRSNV